MYRQGIIAKIIVKKYYNTTKDCILHLYNIAKKGDEERDSISAPVFNFLLCFTVPDAAGKPQVIIHPQSSVQLGLNQPQEQLETVQGLCCLGSFP